MRQNNPRKCIVTGELASKTELLRVVKLKSGEILVDSDAKGRGAYILRDPRVIKDLVAKRMLNRCFRTNVSNDVYMLVVAKLNNLKEGVNGQT